MNYIMQYNGDKMKKIVLATHNKGKAKEFKSLLEDLNFEVLTKDDVGISIDPEENGETLEENAKIKALAIYDNIKKYILADDTGLFVESLNGLPGVHTARYAGENCSDKDNREKLLLEMSGIKNRKAYFETVIALIDKSGKIHYAHGRCNGSISEEERGEKGFGFDKLFIPDGYDKTFAELSEKEKNMISHRSLALLNLKDLLKEEVL